jgi:hypothetical protein
MKNFKTANINHNQMRMLTLITCLIFIVVSVSGHNDTKAKDMFEKSKQKMSLNNVSMILDLETLDKRGDKKSKTLSVSFAEFEDQKKVLIEFIAPEIVNGTKILTTHFPSKKGLIEIYTPANGRIQRIKANQHNLKIMGSKMPISQFVSQDDPDFKYTHLGNEMHNGTECHKIRMQKEGKKKYLDAFVSVENGNLLGIEKFDTHNKLISVTNLSDYIKIDTPAAIKFFPQKIVVKNIKTGESSFLTIREVKSLGEASIDYFTLVSTN